MSQHERLLSTDIIARVLRFEFACLKWALISSVSNWLEELAWTAVAVIAAFVGARFPDGPWDPTWDDLLTALWVALTMFLVILLLNLLKAAPALYEAQKDRADNAATDLEAQQQDVTPDELLQLERTKEKLKSFAEQGREFAKQGGIDSDGIGDWKRRVYFYLGRSLGEDVAQDFHNQAPIVSSPPDHHRIQRLEDASAWLDAQSKGIRLDELERTHRFAPAEPLRPTV